VGRVVLLNAIGRQDGGASATPLHRGAGKAGRPLDHGAAFPTCGILAIAGSRPIGAHPLLPGLSSEVRE
jgi:hypothetical protein